MTTAVNSARQANGDELSHAEFEDLRCACFVGSSSTEVFVAGCQGSMFKIDIEHGEILETVR